jgi:hypothetical protein
LLRKVRCDEPASGGAERPQVACRKGRPSYGSASLRMQTEDVNRRYSRRRLSRKSGRGAACPNAWFQCQQELLPLREWLT